MTSANNLFGNREKFTLSLAPNPTGNDVARDQFAMTYKMLVIGIRLALMHGEMIEVLR